MSSDQRPEGLDLGEQFEAILTGSWKTQALCAAAELRLADLLAEGPRTSGDLAVATGADQRALHRLLQALGSFDICAERADGRFELRPLGTLLREDSPQSLRAWTLWWGKHLWPVWGNLLHSIKTGESARTHLLGTQGFAHLDKDPEAAATFYRVTIELTRETAQSVMLAYDFSGLRQIVDVGGGLGEMLAYVLRDYPDASGVLFDLPRAIEGAEAHYGQNHAGLDKRCRFVAGDFFEAIPAGADAYILKSVIHDWNDERCIRILQNCRNAMADHSRLLIIEPIMPARDADPSRRATFARQDLTMLVALGAQERSEAEFRALINAAGLRISRIVPADPVFNVIECLRAGAA